MEFQPPLPAEVQPGEPTAARLPIHGFRQIIFQPAQAFAGIIAQEKKKTWLAPVLFVTVWIVISALIATLAIPNTSNRTTAGSSRTTTTTQATRTTGNSGGNTNRGNQGGQAQPGGPQREGAPLPGGDFIAIPPQGAIPGGAFPGGAATTPASSAAAASSTPNVWLATLMPVVSFLIAWMLLGGLTNLLSLAFGGHGSSLMAMNIAAWASIPLGIRSIMQIIYYLATNSAIQQPGLSGFAPATGMSFLQHLLSRVDIYLFWQVALLAIGVGLWGGLARKKSWAIAILAVSILILLQSLLGLGLEALGGLNLNTSALLRLR